MSTTDVLTDQVSYSTRFLSTKKNMHNEERKVVGTTLIVI